eukprot:SAG31_NODE_11749_length_1001_cov_1.062084_1_plen_108_part_00
MLATGSDEGVRLWRWADILSSGGTSAPVQEWQPAPGCETNGLAVDAGGTLYAAVGDSKCHSFDLGSSSDRGAFAGHANFLHAVISLDASSRFAPSAHAHARSRRGTR